MKKFIKSKFPLLFISAVFALSGCTKCSGDQSTGAEEGNGLEAPTEKVFSFARTSEPRSLDPQSQFDSASGEIVDNVYSTLLQYSYLKRPYELEPLMLKQMPEFTGPDGLVLEMELKEGIMFHDNEAFPGGKGREVTADDVIYTFKRFADINVNVRSWFMLEGAIEGINEFRKQTEGMTSGVKYDEMDISGIKKLGKYKLSLKLKEKNPLILYALAVSSLSIVPKEGVDHYGDQFRWNPVGTGAFILEEYKKQQKLTLNRNPNYFETYPTEGELGDAEKGLLADAGKKLPLLDRVEMPYIPEDQPRMLKFKKGGLSMIRFGSESSNFIDMAEDDGQGSFKLKGEYSELFDMSSEAMLTLEYISFNLKDKILQNKKLRQAMAYGFDAQGYIDLILNGRAKPMTGMIPLRIAGSEIQLGPQGFTYDMEKAKKLLAEAGYPDGKGLPPITMTMRNTTTATRNSFEFYRANYAKLGIQLKPVFMTFSNYIKATEDSNFQLTEAGWRADYPDAENFYQLRYGPNSPPGPNSSAFDHPEFNKLYEETRLMENGEVRFEKFKRMNEILADEVPIVPGRNLTRVGLIQKWAKNYKDSAMIERPMKYLDIKTQGEK